MTIIKIHDKLISIAFKISSGKQIVLEKQMVLIVL